MKRSAKAIWNGSLKEGRGKITSQSGVLDSTQYSFKSRFEDGIGTNPEELLAAAHAGCFTMMTSALLTEAGYTPDELETECKIYLENGKIILSELSLRAKVPNITVEEFWKIANDAKERCPVSIGFNFDKTLNAELIS